MTVTFKKDLNVEDEAQEDDDMVPALELVLRTKWGKNITVNWNDSTVIL